MIQEIATSISKFTGKHDILEINPSVLWAIPKSEGIKMGKSPKCNATN